MCNVYSRNKLLWCISMMYTYIITKYPSYLIYRKVPKLWDATKLCCNLPKTQTKRPNLRVFRQKDANGIANSEDPDQTAPLEAV